MNKIILKNIQEKISEKIDTSPQCNLCGEKEWILNDAFAQMDLVKRFGGETHSWKPRNAGYLPLISLTCENCGNTHFINLKTLDFNIKDLS